MTFRLWVEKSYDRKRIKQIERVITSCNNKLIVQKSFNIMITKYYKNSNIKNVNILNEVKIYKYMIDYF
jgi:hypothetical protein